MASTIDVAFVEEYNASVHILYQQKGSRLQNTTRKGRVEGKSVYFQKFGGLAAQQKTRNAEHVFIDPEHTRVKADMADWYVPTLVDDLDLLKLNIDERGAHQTVHVAALGRKVDEILLAAMTAGAAGEVGDATKPFGYEMAMRVLTQFSVDEVPDDGDRFCALHPFAWAQFLQVPEFANADYVGADRLPFAGGMTAKMWMGIMWMPLPNIALSTGGTPNIASNVAWHRSAVGHGVNKEIDTIWDYENTRSAYSCVSKMSLGATVIEDKGVRLVSSLSPLPAIPA